MIGRLVLVAALVAGARVAAAEPVVAGTRVASKDELGGRRAIRGAVIEGRESDELGAMRRYEEEQLAALYGRGGPSVAAGEAPERYATLALPDIPVRWDARLVRFLDFYREDRRGRAIMSSWLRAQGRYRTLMEDALRRHHLPHALLYISMIESGYDPHDRSLVGASGLWQFMPEGARIYGLRVDHWVDERDDPEKATEAAMRYLADLWSRFGSWHLALAAFNAGYGAALAAEAKYNTNDYWTLCTYEDGLPWETVLYVPKFLAAAIVGENRAAFGYHEVAADPALAWETVTVGSSITVEEGARAAGVSSAEVARLNPELRQGRTPPGEPWSLKLPSGSGPRFLARAAALDKERETLATYRVRQGDRIESVARGHRTTAAHLRRLNGLKDVAAMRPGLTLLVPPQPKLAMRPGGSDEPAPPLIVAVSSKEAASPDGRKRVFYRCTPGDGVVEIARHFGVTEEELVRWNRLDPRARLTSSLVMQLWVSPERLESGELAGAMDPEHPEKAPGPLQVVSAGSEEFLDLVEGQKGRKRVKYTLRAGDTLKRVGLRFGLAEGDMERINQIGRGTALEPGRTLVVYVPMSAEEREEFARRLAGSPAGDCCNRTKEDAAQSGEARAGEPQEGAGASPPAPSPSGAPEPDASPEAVPEAAEAAPANDATAPKPVRLPTLPEPAAAP